MFPKSDQYEKLCRKLQKAVVVGGGFIGLEMAENLMEKGLSVTLIDMAHQLMPTIFDAEMADFIRRKLQEKGLRILVGTALNSIVGDGKVKRGQNFRR